MTGTQLPIGPYLEAIVSADAPYIIVVGPKGCSNTTQIPLAYLQAGNRVLVTEPNIGTAEFVAQQQGYELGNEVGWYRTTYNRNFSSETDLLFIGQSFQLIHELTEDFDILVIDELEWTMQQSMIEAWAWKEIQENTSRFQKIVVQSSMIDAERLSRMRGNAPIFQIPESSSASYPVTVHAPGDSILLDTVRLVREGYDILIFPSSLKAMDDLSHELHSLKVDADIHLYRGVQYRDEKKKKWIRTLNTTRSKVVISSESLEWEPPLKPSPGRKLAIIDAGQESRTIVIDEMLTHVLTPLPKARSWRRRNRTGHYGPGIYIDHCPVVERPEYPTPSFLHSSIDELVLRLASVGYEVHELLFAHKIESRSIERAQELLRILGAFDENNQITEIGQAMAQLPISVRNARMIIEAQRLDVIQELVTITATFIRGHLGAPSGGWKQLVSTERESDFVTQLLLEEKTRGMTHSQRVEMGINAKRFSLVQKTRRRLLRELYLNPTENSVYSEQKRGRIIQACLAGLVDHIFWKSGESQQSLYTDRSGRIYTLDSQSIVKDADLIVGWPTAVQRPSGEIIRTIYMATKADPSWIDPVTSRIVVERINPHTQPIQPQSVPTAMFIEPSYRQSETGIEEKGRRKPSQRAESQSTNPSSQTDDGPVSQAALEALLRKFNRRV